MHTTNSKARSYFHNINKKYQAVCSKNKLGIETKVRVCTKTQSEFFLLFNKMAKNTWMYILFFICSPFILLGEVDGYLDKISTVRR